MGRGDADADSERDAFVALYREHVAAVYRYCRHRLGTDEEAEDATSHIFLKAFAAYSTQREPGSVRSWLFAIAHHDVTDRYRTRARRNGLLTSAWDGADGTRSPEDVALDLAEQDEVHALLRGLPDEQRRVLELRLAGLETAEIARVLGKSAAVVRMTQSRAIARLRQTLVPSVGRSPDEEG